MEWLLIAWLALLAVLVWVVKRECWAADREARQREAEQDAQIRPYGPWEEE